MSYTIKQANEYVAKVKPTVVETYKPKFHLAPLAGWLNDPNGLCYFDGKYRLFYQFNPYATTPDAMHWGYCISDDMISFTDMGVALCPTEVDETDCFSGGGIVSGGALNLVYTRHYEIKDIKKEQVCIVKSTDGSKFVKHIPPVFDNETLPKNISRIDFRDPFPVQVGDKFYVLLGGKDVLTDKGIIVVLVGNSLDKLEYDFTIGPFYELGDMAECPCYCKVGDKDVIIVSGCHVEERDGCFKNTHASVFIAGKLDLSAKSMTVEYVKEIDKGDTFYAPQIVNGIDKPVIIGWLEMWNKPYPTREMDHGWTGAFTVPRELSLENGEILQRPTAELDKYLVRCERRDETPKSAVIDAVLPVGGSVILQGDNGQVVIGNDGCVYLDTVNANNMNGCIRRAPIKHVKSSVKIVLDVSCIEVFVDGGREVISSRFYIDGRLRIQSHGGADVSVYAFEEKNNGGKNED